MQEREDALAAPSASIAWRTLYPDVPPAVPDPPAFGEKERLDELTEEEEPEVSEILPEEIEGFSVLVDEVVEDPEKVVEESAAVKESVNVEDLSEPVEVVESIPAPPQDLKSEEPVVDSGKSSVAAGERESEIKDTPVEESTPETKEVSLEESKPEADFGQVEITKGETAAVETPEAEELVPVAVEAPQEESAPILSSGKSSDQMAW